jgi:leukotriene-A4 hydrolase
LTFVTPTLLAGDRSLADVIAHEIAHSWTGNLVTNATWGHFWLNEGWTTWFQRKIMSRIHNDPLFIDFDAIGGYKSLQTTVASEVPSKYTKLVLPIEDTDPDDIYSTVAYEKGFNLLLALERRVGSKEFEAFFQAYVNHFQSRTLTSEDFQAFFMYLFDENPAVGDFDWASWLYGEGMPPETPSFDRTLSKKSDDLAAAWLAMDRDGRNMPTEDTSTWSSLQITNFLDELQTLAGDTPLKVETLNAMNRVHTFTDSRNSEILFRFCYMCVESEDLGILSAVIYFITAQGRMKFVRPLYRAMYKSEMAKEIAQQVFLDHKDFYHPICAKMIASDLMIGKQAKISTLRVLGYTALAGAVAAGLGFVLLKRKHY